MPRSSDQDSDHAIPPERWLDGQRASNKNLTARTLGAFKWTYGSYAASGVVQLGYTAVMARLLAPEDFGLVAMASLFLRFGGYFAQMGVGQALIQKAVLTQREIRTGFTTSFVLGALMSAGFFAAAPVAALMFDSSRVVDVSRVLALSFLLQGMGITAESLLRRNLRFRTLAFVEVGSSVVGYMAVGVVCALAGMGVWSLVAAGLAQAAMRSVIVMALVRHPARPLVAGSEILTLYSFGGRVSVISFFEFLGTSLDTLFIGRYAGESLLGQYNRARLLVQLPLDKLTQGTSKVLFPAFSRIQADAVRLRGAYLSGLRMITLLVIPAAAGMAVAADQIALVVLGPQWTRAGEVLPYLAILVAVTLSTKMAAITCEATAALNAKLALTVGHVALLAVLLTLSIGGSLEDYATAIALAGGARFLAYTLLMRRVVHVGWMEHARALGPVLATALAAAGAIWTVTASLNALVATSVVLAAQLVTGLVVVTVAVVVGPLGVTRRDIHQRLAAANLLTAASRTGKAAGRILRHGR